MGQLRSKRKSREEQKAAASRHQRAVSIGAEALLAECFLSKWPSMPKSEPTTPVSGTPRSDAGSAIAHGPFAAEVDKVPCPVRETFDWTDVRGVRKQPIRPPVEQNWHTDVTRAHPNPVEPAARAIGYARAIDNRDIPHRTIAAYGSRRYHAHPSEFARSARHSSPPARTSRFSRYSRSGPSRRISSFGPSEHARARPSSEGSREVELTAPPLLVKGCGSVRQVEWSLNNIPENNAIVGANGMVIVYSNRKRAYFTCVRGPDCKWRVGNRCSFQPQTKTQLQSIELLLRRGGR